MSLARSLQRFRNRNKGISQIRNRFHFEQLEPRLLLSGDLQTLAGGELLKDALLTGEGIYIESEEDSGPRVDMALADPALPPMGSLIHTSLVTADFFEVGESDMYTLELDTGQRLTLALQPRDSSILSQMEVYDPYENLLVSATASDYGDPIFLQILPIENSGTYTIVAKSIEGSGKYDASYWLNSVFETENLGGEGNDDLTSAIEISPSSIAMPWGADRLAVVGITDDEAYDYYYFGLGMGEIATIGLTAIEQGLPEGSLTLELLDSSDNLLTIGQDEWQNIDEVIRDFVAPEEGEYFCRVSGEPGVEYTLIVIRGGGFDLEPNSKFEDAHDLFGSGVVLGSIGQLSVGGAIHVAVIGSGNSSYDSGLQSIVDQLNDDSYFDFNAVLISPWDGDTVEELEVYNVVVIGGTGYDWYQFCDFASTLLPYVEGGGSLVTTGWGIYASGGLSEWGLGEEFDAVVPVNTIDGYNYFYGEWIDPVGWHPIIEGVNSFYVDTYIEFSGGYPQVDDNATVLATVFEEEMGEVPIAAVAEIGDGRSVYLGLIYAGGSGYYTEGLRSGDPDRFLEQAIAWAAREGGTDSADIYLIHVNKGDNLTINTSTPGDGEGEPLNDLDTMLELYDPDGNLVSSDDNSASDERNAEISYNAESSGDYLVRISSVSGGGEYILQIEGATGAISRPFWVTGSSITDGALLNTIPEHLTLNFSEPVLLTTLEAGDLKVNGDPAAGFTVIDSNTIRFDIGSLITDEGDYHVTIDEALVKDIHGTSNQGWGLSFYFDITYPEVIDTNISDGEVIPSGALTITATFSEEMASAGVGIEDVWLIENFSGKKINASSLSFNEVNQITAELPLLGDGFYTLTLASGPQAFRDLAGNYLNGGDSFTLNFSVDSDVNPFPVPLNEKLPTGSLVFDPPIESAFHETGDMDAYTLELDSGQVLSVRLNPVDGSFQGRLRVFDPFDNLLGEVTSGGAGMIVYLQTLPVTEAGTYRIEAESITGAGRYRLFVLLNAAFERNRFLGDGDTLGLAQDIDLSFIDLGDVSRGSVRGNLSASNYASRPVSGLANIFSAGLDSAFDGILPPFVRFSTGSGKIITFPSITGLVSAGGDLMNGADGGDFFSGTTDILSYQGISGIIYGKGDPDFPDYETYPELGYNPGKTMFLVGVFLGPDAPTEPAPERLDFTDSPYGIGTDFIDLYPEIGQTFFIGDGLTSEGELQQFHVPEGATRLFLGFADAEQFGYPSSEPGYYGDNAGNLNVNISLNTIQSPDRDWYSFTLNEGQVTTITLTHDSHDQAPNVSLRLFDEAGNLLTVGMRDAFNVDRYIAEFLPTSTGTYYVRVGGTTPGNYSLLITRGSGFDLEPNDMNSQSLNLASAILGGLGGLGRGISEDEPTGEVELGINLYDGTGYLWDISDQGSIGDGTSDAYDGGMQNSDFPYFETAKTENGGREIVIGPALINGVEVTRKIYIPENQGFARFLEIVHNPGSETVSYTVPIYTNLGSDGSESFVYTSSGDSLVTMDDDWVITDDQDGIWDPTVTHVVAGQGGRQRSSFFNRDGDDIEYKYDLILAPGETKIVMHFASQAPNQAVALERAPRLASLDSELDPLSGMTSIELSQVVNFNVGDAIDQFQFFAEDGALLVIETSTPVDGTGEPVNGLNPRLELYNPNGDLIISDDDSAGDGKNARIEYTVPEEGEGTYRIRILAEGGTSGTYILTIDGATTTPEPLMVTSANPEDSSHLAIYPATYRLDLSSPVLFTSVDGSDLKVNDISADSVILVDADTLEFSISSSQSGDGPYTVTIQEGAFVSISGGPVLGFSSIFYYDATPPTIMDSSVEEGEILEPGDLTLAFTISEDLAESGLGAEDVLLANIANGRSYNPSSFIYDSETDIVTVQYANLTEGNYELTLISGESAFRDVAGNPLNGDTSDPEPDDFILHFNIDAPIASLPTLNPTNPLGSLVYESEVSERALHNTGDEDLFTISLDPGQTLGVVVLPTYGDVRIALEVFDPEGGSLGYSEAEAGGRVVLLQTIPINTFGTYEIVVKSLEGIGEYWLGVLLNAAVESEIFGGPSNDTMGTAEDLNGSFITIGSDRAAVVGQRFSETESGSLPFFSGHYYELVTTSMYWTSAKVAAEGRSYLGVSGHLATITSIEESLFITNTFGSSINGAWLGGYQPEGSVEPGGGWSWVTGEPFIFTNWGSGEPNNSGGYEHYLQFRSDSDTEGKLWNDLSYWNYQYYLVEYDIGSAEDDWYFVTLSEGEKASFLLTSEGSFSTSNLSLELYDSSGNLLTAGIDVAANVDEAIVDFLAPAGGNYYIRVSGDVLGDYTLVVTRDLSFEIEPLSSSVVQDISPTNEILGALGFSGSGGGGGEIRVAVLGGGNTVSQLNDDTYFNFTATSVNASQIDTLVELNNYDVVVMGASQSKAELNQLAPVLRQWVEAGHGVVATGWTVYYAGSSSGAVVTDIDAIVPVNLNSSYYYDYYPTITIIDNSHPVTSGVTSFSASSQYAELTYGGIDSGATLLGTVSGYPAVVVGQSGSGRGVYLSPVYPYYTWTTGMADRLLEQAVAWAAGDSYDDYLIQVNEGDTLTISTRTPNDGSGEPLNLLDPRLELYDPDGNLVASDMDSGPDERNAELNYEALITGSYKVRVIREEGLGSGEYVFKVTGATGTFNAKPVVVSTNPSEGKTFSIPPESLTLDLSEGIRADSVGIDDLTIDHDASVTGIEIVDGDTIRFLLSVPDIEGTYTYTLLEDSVIDLLGEGNVSYTGTFVIDHTPPFVISQSPEVQSLSPFNSWSVTFSEPLDPSSVQTSDFVLRNPNNYTISISSTTLSADRLTVTLSFSNQYTQGNYTLTVGPEITDLAGNRMDQDSATDGNQTYVGTIQVAAPDLNPVSITVTLPDGSPLPTEGVPLGSTVRVTWTVRNIGADAARANYWYDRIYISSNNNTNVSGDTQLNYFTVDVDPLAGNGGQYTMTQNVTLPLNDSFFASTYYLKVWVDGYSNQPETNENNNILASTAFTTVIPPLPDLIVTNVTAPAIVEAGKAAHIEWTDVNQGGAATTGSGWYDRVVLSGNTVFGDSDDVTFYSYYWYSGTLDAGGSVNRSLDVTISTGLVGNWYVLVKADVYSNIYERLENENNNVGVSAMQMNVVMATEDLSPLSLTAPDSAVFGETINVSWTVGNIGTGLTVSNWYDRIWLSRDTTPGNADDVSLTQISSVDVTPLAPGAQYNRSVENIQLPLSQSWNPGSYYLVLQTDTYNQEPETNENNNTMVRSISLSLPPIADLMVSNVTVTPSNINSGDMVEIRWTLTNNGTASASNFWDCVYLNKDNILDGSYSYYLSEFKFNDILNPGESKEIVQNVTIPIDRPGDWYLVVRADIYNDIYEHQNENNNQAVSNQIHAPLPPLPDLIVIDISAPKDALSGQTIPISWTIRNKGQKDIIDGQWTDTIFFSYDGGASNNYHVGNFTYTGSLPAGQSVTRLIDFTLPSTLEGLRWVVVYTDYSDNYYEHDGENNNRMVDDTHINVKFPPLPNLQVTGITPPTNLYSSQNGLVSWQVTNVGIGDTSSPFWWDEVHLSLNEIYGDGDDIYLGSAQNPSYLPSGKTYENSLSFTVPQGLSGNFYFVIKTDTWNNVFEAQFENDNTLASSLIEIQLTSPPDLQVTEVVAPADAFSGQSISLSWTVTNEGDGRTLQTGWYDRVYMSSDTTIDSGDTNLGEVWHSGALDPDESYSVNRSFNLPIGVVGEFYFIVRTDSHNHVYEHASDSNNDGYDEIPTTILLTPPPDLEVTDITTPSEVLAGHSLNVSYRVENFGSTETPNTFWLDTLWLSSDTMIDSSDIHLGDYLHYGKLGQSGGTLPNYYDRTVTVTLPNGISGEYFIIVHNDSRNEVFEGFPNVTGEGPNANNVLESNPIGVLLRPADLVIESLNVPSEGEAGKQIKLSWVVRNIGTGDTIVSSWGCRIIVSQDDILGDTDDVHLRDFYHTGLLNSGEGYTASGLIELPFTMASGDYVLFVVTDFGNNVYESDETNNWTSAPLSVIRQTPDLQFVSGSSSGGMAGGPIDVSFRVENRGENRTNSNFWYDDIHLSRDTVLGSGDIYLGSIRHTNILEPDEGYDVSVRFTLPIEIQTVDWYIIIRTDADNRVLEDVGEGNNILSIGPITITPYDPNSGIPIPINFLRPDLQVISVEAPYEAISGQPLTVSWEVGNYASDPTGERSWYDSVYLSRDPYLDSSDIYLGYVWQTRNLGCGETYISQGTFNIPYGQSGPFYVFVATDRGYQVTESNENNNFGYDSEFLNVNLAPPADLVLDTITIPVNGIPGHITSLTYSVNNQGVNPALGSWKDTLYLSTDDVWDINDALFGSKVHYGTVSGGESYSETMTAPLPGVTPGTYYVILRTDILNNVPESNELNNIGASLDQIEMDIDSLILGTPATGNLSSGQAVYYKLEAEEGETIRIKFDSSIDDIANELYVRFGEMPNLGEFDFASREGFNPDPEILIPTTIEGTYYIMAYGQWAPGSPSYSILAEAIPFSIIHVKANKLGNSGDATVLIEGAKFASDTKFFLVSPDETEIPARRIFIENTSLAYVSFDLFGASTGLYDLKALQSNGSTTKLSDAVEIIEGEGPAVFMSIYGPEAVMVNRLSLFILNYVNDGDADTIAPLLVMESRSATLLGFSASDLRTTPFHIMAASMDGPMDILRPGSNYSIPVVFNSGSIAQRLDIRVGRIMPDDTRLIEDWSSIEAIVKPAGISDSEWNNFWGRIQPQIGSTWGDYVKLLNRMMVTVSEPDHPVRDVREIFLRMYEQNPDFIPYSSMSGEVRDSLSGNPLSDLEVAAYLITEDGEQVLQGRGLTDENGHFNFGHLIPGTYKVSIIGRAFDMDRDGLIDIDTPQFIVTEEESTKTGILYIQPTGMDITDDDSNPALIRDASGITHIVWNREGLVWHAWYDNESGNWRDAAPISNEQSYAPSIASSPYLINGVSSGLIATWQQGSGNEAEIWYAVARNKSGRGYEWSSPVQLTDDAVLDTAPEVIVGDTGVAMITYLKRDASIQDDGDLYYNIIAIFSSDLIWPSSQILDEETPIEAEGVSISWGRQWKFGPWDFFGTEAEISLSLSGQVGENDCKASLNASGQLSGSFKGSSIRSTISGSGSVGAEWSVNQAACDWKFDRATAGWSAGAQFDWRYGLSTLLSKIPHPAVTAAYGLYRAAIYLGEKIGLEFEDGITFGGNASFTNMEWKFTQPFPDFVWPESIAEASISGLIGIYAQLDVKPTGDSVRVEGNLTVNVDIAPAVQLKSVTGNIIFSGNIGPFPFNETFTVTLYQGEGLESLGVIMEPLDDEPVFDPSAMIGTGNAYGVNHVLADVSGDLLNDSTMSLASDDGVIFGAWQQMADPYGDQFGYVIKVAEYGNSWSSPVIIPDSLGINSYVTAAVDGLGHRLVLWSFADGISLSETSTFEDYLTASDGADIVYSLYDEDLQSWSSPIKLAEIQGRDYGIAIGHDASGNIILTWVNVSGGLNHLLTSTWNGSTWSEVQEITSGESILMPAMERLGEDMIVVWGEDANPDPGQVENMLRFSIFNGSDWSSPVTFDPIALFTGLALSAGQQTISSSDVELKTEAIFPPFPVPEDCCKCKPEDIKRVTESAPNCREGGGTGVTFDEKTCTEKTIVYQPCARRPRDPNDIIGPPGFGEEHWVASKDVMDYTIHFENAPDATASAQEVFITQQLDSDLDWRTFRVDDFGFGDQRIELGGNQAFYKGRLDFSEDLGFYLDVLVNIDVTTGIATWKLTTIDPTTGEIPVDPNLGFLPPNKNPETGEKDGRGEGFVSYTIKPKRSVKTGDVVDAGATIVFDTEGPIDTPPYFNTLDAVAPSSEVHAFGSETTKETEFLVSWGGVDDEGGSAIQDYTVYVSEDGGSYSVWLFNTTLTESIFKGASGHIYAFYSTARDNAGNEETPPSSPDAVITVEGFGSISGKKFEDRDGDGVLDTNELGLGGWTIYLDMDNDGSLNEGDRSAITSEDGSYIFEDLEPGVYTVREVLKTEWIQTAPGSGSFTVTVSSGQPNDNIHFGNFKLGEIRGVKYHDLNGDGQRDPDEPNLTGWTVFLDMDRDGMLDDEEPRVVTGEDGTFVFTDIGPSLVQIGEVVQEGWARTTPEITYKVTSGFSRVVDIGNVQLGSLSGVKFNDLDGDGVKDEGEPGISGWTIFIDQNTNGALDFGEVSTQTDDEGRYNFDNLLPGIYIVAEIEQPGWIQTSPLDTVPVGFSLISTSGSRLSLQTMGFG